MNSSVPSERILVCVGPSRGTARVVRAAHRIAVDLGAVWIAAGVGAVPTLTRDGSRERLEAHLAIAETLGAEIVRIEGSRASEALLECARRRGVTRIVVGEPRAHLADLVHGSLVGQLIRGAGAIRVQIVAREAGIERFGLMRGVRSHAPLKDHVGAFFGVAATTTVARVAGSILAPPDVVLLYLLAISATAYRFGRGPALVAAASSVAAYNFFFVAPFHTFAVADVRHLLTFAVMFGVGLAISTFTERVRVQQADALDRERRTAALYALTRDLAMAPDEQILSAEVVRLARRSLGPASLLSVGGTGQISGPGDLVLGPSETSAVVHCARTGAPTGPGTSTIPEARVRCLPVVAVGAVAVLAVSAEEPLDPDDAHAFAGQVGLALARVRLAARAEEAALRARTEEVRSALLSTVSHDLRTPLAAITGAATALLETPDRLAPTQRQELTEGIRDEAERLERLVGNLLDMTRVASGSLEPRREWVPLEELLGSALHRVASTLSEHPVTTRIAADLPLLRVDAVLMEHVLVNLLENAVRHTPPGTPIAIRGRVRPGVVEVEVTDTGPGLPAGDPARLFEPFVRGDGRRAGSGLGLAICRGIVRAHGGEIDAANGPDGGAVFRFGLPLEEQPPAVPVGVDT